MYVCGVKDIMYGVLLYGGLRCLMWIHYSLFHVYMEPAGVSALYIFNLCLYVRAVMLVDVLL